MDKLLPQDLPRLLKQPLNMLTEWQLKDIFSLLGFRLKEFGTERLKAPRPSSALLLPSSYQRSPDGVGGIVHFEIHHTHTFWAEVRADYDSILIRNVYVDFGEGKRNFRKVPATDAATFINYLLDDLRVDVGFPYEGPDVIYADPAMRVSPDERRELMVIFLNHVQLSEAEQDKGIENE